jgi:hypothetical protein
MMDTYTSFRLRAEKAEAEVERLRKLYNEAQNDASREAERRVFYQQEVERLREELQQAIMASDFDRAEVKRLTAKHGVYRKKAVEDYSEIERLQGDLGRAMDDLLRVGAEVERLRGNNNKKLRIRVGSRAALAEEKK